ncbi:MAG: ribonuclease PH [Anaerolineae bacterium]|nr:ribonuclease PH [Anaerolineae bacterium]MDW8097863.1 ribonuclease PH [Anaerolineae bacterium]
MYRPDGRAPDALRPVAFTLDYITYPEGSVLITCGATRVLCNVSVEEQVPAWLAGRGQGWITAEYALLPRSTHVRTPREDRGPSGRTQEIRRLIGRSLRAAVNLEALGERTLIVDCDVLQADGGTRTASITGGWVAVALTLSRLIARGLIGPDVFKTPVAAVSVGVVEGMPLLDLCYQEDAQAAVDCNVVMTGAGEYVEIQGTAEGKPFTRAMLDQLLSLAEMGIRQLLNAQRAALTAHPDGWRIPW